MELQNKNQKIDVEELKQRLLKRKTIRTRFSLPLTEEQTIDALTAAYMAEVEYRHQKFFINDNMKESIYSAAKWLKEQKKFGLMLCGLPGNGKTTLMRAIQSLINCMDMKDEYNNSLGVVIKDVREIVRLSNSKIRDTPMLGIDDFGTEPLDVLDYGNVLNPILDLLSHRYNEQLFTIMTTNLIAKDIRDKYNDRIADRFNEMMQVIVFKNKSYRGKIQNDAL